MCGDSSGDRQAHSPGQFRSKSSRMPSCCRDNSRANPQPTVTRNPRTRRRHASPAVSETSASVAGVHSRTPSLKGRTSTSAHRPDASSPNTPDRRDEREMRILSPYFPGCHIRPGRPPSTFPWYTVCRQTRMPVDMGGSKSASYHLKAAEMAALGFVCSSN